MSHYRAHQALRRMTASHDPPEIDLSFDAAEFEYRGQQFRATLVYDDHQEEPWSNNDIYGAVRRDGTAHRLQGGKKPGERPMNDPDRHGYQYYYDWQQAIRNAKAERKKGYVEVVQQEFDWLANWCRNEWWYVMVCVDRLVDGEDVNTSTMSSVRSDDTEGQLDIIIDIADDLIDIEDYYE